MFAEVYGSIASTRWFVCRLCLSFWCGEVVSNAGFVQSILSFCEANPIVLGWQIVKTLLPVAQWSANSGLENNDVTAYEHDHRVVTASSETSYSMIWVCCPHINRAYY